MALTKYQKFVKANKHHKLPNGSLDLKKIGKLWSAKKGGKSKSTPKKKSKPRAKPKKVTTTSKKPAPRKRPRGKAERKKDDFKKEFTEIARSLNVPMGKTSFKFISGTWRLRIMGLGKTVKRAKLSEAMKLVRKRARAKI